MSTSWGRNTLTQAWKRTDHPAQIAALLSLLLAVIGFMLWPSLNVVLGVAAAVLFLQILHRLPGVADEGLGAMDRTGRPAAGHRGRREAEPASQDAAEEPGPANFWNQILWPVKMGLVALAGFIIFTQEEYRPIALAVLAAILPEISKLLPELNTLLSGLKPKSARASAG
jgi:hypothetical protein